VFFEHEKATYWYIRRLGIAFFLAMAELLGSGSPDQVRGWQLLFVRSNNQLFVTLLVIVAIPRAFHFFSNVEVALISNNTFF